MTRPRRAKKAARKAAPKKRLTRAQKLAQIAKEQLVAYRKNDPFHLREDLIPRGWAYQWKIKGEEVPQGWHAVPFSRHAHDFPRSANYQGSIVIKGLILMETTSDQAASETYAPQKQALEWAKDREIAMGVAIKQEGRGFALLDEDEIVTKVLRNAPPEVGPEIDVPITMLIRVPAKWAAAAAYLNLTIAEYSRRRIVMQHVALGTFSREGEEAIYRPINLRMESRDDI